MKKFKLICIVSLMICFSYGLSSAHFGMVIPSDNMVMQEDSKKIELQLSFSHPFEMVGMPLVKPEGFYVIKDGKKQELNAALKETKVMDHKAYICNGTQTLLGTGRRLFYCSLYKNRSSRFW